MTVVITPVGTSLFTNGSETNNHNNQIQTGFCRIEDKPASEWNDNSRYINALKTHSETFIRNQNTSASAELQSTAKIQNTLNSDITVYLLASDTIASRLAAEILSGNVAAGILGGQVSVNFNPEQDVISGLQVNNRKIFLKKGMNALIRRIDQINLRITASGQSLAINITGGYGASVPYLTIYAQLKSVPLYYNFEDSNELIEIPHSPLTIDWNAIGPHFDVLQKIDNAEAINNWAKFKEDHYEAVAILGPFIWVDQSDNSAYVSPLGEAFWDECLKRKHEVPFPDPVTTAPDEMEKINNSISGEEHHRPRGWRPFVNRLCDNAYVEYVRYDATVHGGSSVKVLDAGVDGHIGVQYTKDNETLPLRVVTTATGNPQTELVMEFIKRQLNL